MMQGIYARYNEQKNCIDVAVYEAVYVLWLDCGKWEDGIKTTMNSQGWLDALAIDEPMEYVRLVHLVRHYCCINGNHYLAGFQ